MKYLFNYWPQLEKEMRNCPHIFLLLDYDGTLTPIVSRPEKAALDNDIKKILARLSKQKDRFTMGIISGRKLSEIKKMVGLREIFYCGNHGLEVDGPGIKFVHPVSRNLRPDLKAIKEALQNRIRKISGAWIEDKGLGLALHYRLVEHKDVPQIKEIFRQITLSQIKKRKITLGFGKKVLEVRPATDWNKGKAVKLIEKLMKKKRDSLTIYLGDDHTDEDAFRVLGRRDISIFVGGPKKSSAKYFLRNTEEVKFFLETLPWLS